MITIIYISIKRESISLKSLIIYLGIRFAKAVYFKILQKLGQRNCINCIKLHRITVYDFSVDLKDKKDRRHP